MASPIRDLKTSEQLEDTIVMIGGKYGRTPSRDGDAPLDHTKLTFLHSVRNFRLTDVSGRIAHGILA